MSGTSAYANNRLREVAKKRIRSVKILMDAKDYEGAAYMMGLAGEIALKAVVCKHLRLADFPPSNIPEGQQKSLKTHNHAELLLLAGLNHELAVASGTPVAQNWSDYTTHYKGDWIGKLRYNEVGNNQRMLTDAEVVKLYDVLIVDKDSIINYIKRKHLW